MLHDLRSFLDALLVALGGPVMLGCGSIPPVLDPDAVAVVQATLVQSQIDEPQITVEWVRSSYGSGLGWGGRFVDLGVNRGREEGAMELARPLQAETVDFDFRQPYWNALERVLKRTPWLKANGMERNGPAAKITEDAVLMHGLLRLGTAHKLSPDCSVFLIYNFLEYYEQGDPGGPSAEVAAVYRSEPVAPVVDEQAVQLWAANHATAFRAAVHEGIEESAKMIKLALLCMGGASCPAAPHHVEFELNQGRGDYGIPVGRLESEGTIVEHTPYRVIIRDEGGSFVSLPKSAIRSD